LAQMARTGAVFAGTDYATACSRLVLNSTSRYLCRHVPPHEATAAESASLSRSAARRPDAGPASQGIVLGLGVLQRPRMPPKPPRGARALHHPMGADSSSDLLRRSFRCSFCGGKGRDADDAEPCRRGRHCTVSDPMMMLTRSLTECWPRDYSYGASERLSGRGASRRVR
jgi:hypothetical protein